MTATCNTCEELYLLMHCAPSDAGVLSKAVRRYASAEMPLVGFGGTFIEIQEVEQEQTLSKSTHQTPSAADALR